MSLERVLAPQLAETLQRRLQDCLPGPLFLAISEEETPVEGLSAGERKRLEEMRHPLRRTSWLKGRSALKQLLLALGESTDTSLIHFPHARLSLTHSGAFAIAVGFSPEVQQQGLGIDFEHWRAVKPQAGRFFLTPMEREWLAQQPAPEQSMEALRLWTVKEAVLKSDLSNAGTTYTAYETQDPSVASGNACGHSRQFRYETLALPTGLLSLSLCLNVTKGNA